MKKLLIITATIISSLSISSFANTQSVYAYGDDESNDGANQSDADQGELEVEEYSIYAGWSFQTWGSSMMKIHVDITNTGKVTMCSAGKGGTYSSIDGVSYDGGQTFEKVNGYSPIIQKNTDLIFAGCGNRAYVTTIPHDASAITFKMSRVTSTGVIYGDKRYINHIMRTYVFNGKNISLAYTNSAGVKVADTTHLIIKGDKMLVKRFNEYTAKDPNLDIDSYYYDDDKPSSDVVLKDIDSTVYGNSNGAYKVQELNFKKDAESFSFKVKGSNEYVTIPMSSFKNMLGDVEFVKPVITETESYQVEDTGLMNFFSSFLPETYIIGSLVAFSWIYVIFIRRVN